MKGTGFSPYVNGLGGAGLQPLWERAFCMD